MPPDSTPSTFLSDVFEDSRVLNRARWTATRDEIISDRRLSEESATRQ